MTEKARAWGETVEKEVQDGGGGGVADVEGEDEEGVTKRGDGTAVTLATISSTVSGCTPMVPSFLMIAATMSG